VVARGLLDPPVWVRGQAGYAIRQLAIHCKSDIIQKHYDQLLWQFQATYDPKLYIGKRKRKTK